jgi:sugar/nucleoside kinase (ribokinase family)
LKKGEHGSMLFEPEGAFFCPAHPNEVIVDPTGAGDAFAGGFLGYLDREGAAEPLPVRQAMVCGTAVASLCVEDFSPKRLAEATREEIAERIRSIREMGFVPEMIPWAAPES